MFALNWNKTTNWFFSCVFIKNGVFVHSINWSHCWIWHFISPYNYPKLCSGQHIILSLDCCTFYFHYQSSTWLFIQGHYSQRIKMYAITKVTSYITKSVERQSCHVCCRLKQWMGSAKLVSACGSVPTPTRWPCCSHLNLIKLKVTTDTMDLQGHIGRVRCIANKSDILTYFTVGWEVMIRMHVAGNTDSSMPSLIKYTSLSPVNNLIEFIINYI